MKDISKATIDRLPVYLRALRMAQDEGLDVISSEELGHKLEITAEQIRKDLALFGQFGKKGVGYYVNELKHSISKILGLDNHWNIAIIGIGHLGSALSNYHNFISLGFNLVALFDHDPAIIGTTVNHVKVRDIARLEESIEKFNIHIGIITVPRQFAQEIADRLVNAKIKGIWNFAPIRIKVPADMHIVNEDLSVGLACLSYHITRKPH